jgi:hypothetical protein
VAIPPAAERWKPKSPPSPPGLKQGNPLDHRSYFSNAIFGDFDNDGWLDLVVLDRHEQPTRPVYLAALFLNRGDGTFQLKPTTFSGLDSTGSTKKTEQGPRSRTCRPIPWRIPRPYTSDVSTRRKRGQERFTGTARRVLRIKCS